MNILIVKAHPSTLGHTHRIAQTYADVKIAKKHDVKILDLFAEENKLDYMRFEKIRERPIDPVQKKFQDQLIWADEIVVVHPVWWGTPPSILKTWTEQAFWPGIAYKYSPEGKVMKLLKGKTAKVFATSGGPGWINEWFFMPLWSFWNISIFWFSGVEVTDFKVCGNLDKYRGERADAIFEKFLLRVKKSAEKIH
jgi:NAD(P)H dehydrogenase (quinone)